MSRQERTLAIAQWHKDKENLQLAYDTFYVSLCKYIDTPTTENKLACREERKSYESMANMYYLMH